jgi:hypothetical protein
MVLGGKIFRTALFLRGKVFLNDVLRSEAFCVAWLRGEVFHVVWFGSAEIDV